MPNSSQLTDLLPTLGSGRVLVVGDLMLDRYVTGTVDRVSPEAPIPVMRVGGEVEMLGGAGNVARNAASLGAQVTLVGLIGGDSAGARVADLISESDGIDFQSIVGPGIPTTVKARYLASGQQLLRTDTESRIAPSSDTLSLIVNRAREALKSANVVVLSDYAKGVLTDDVITDIVAAASDLDVPVVVDPKSVNFSRYRGASLLTPNRDELSRATGIDIDGDDAAARAALQSVADAAVGAVLVTRGAQGMTLVVAGQDAIHLRTRAREVFDVSGAGDTVVATVAAVVAAGHGLESAAALANVAGGVVVGKIGTAVVRADEMIASLHSGALLGAEEKVVTLETALDRVALWRRHDRSVVFTNGCFDLIHPGHISLLEQARAAGDALVVGLNSDASVSRLKGEERPVQPAAARASVLAGLATVDLVVEFGEDTPDTLIEAIKPDVLVKGADYAEEDVVGGDFVTSYGGRVFLAELAKGHSTSDTIDRASRRRGGKA